MEYAWNLDETPETPEQIAFYKAEIARMFAEMDAIEKRIDETQARTAILSAKTQATIDSMKARKNDLEPTDRLRNQTSENGAEG